MYTAILLDGTKDPVCIMLDGKDGKGKSISWSGSATNPVRSFNFVESLHRDKGSPSEKEVLVYSLLGLKTDSRVLGLRIKDKPLTVAEQGRMLADQFLYPEKYIEAGMEAAA